MNPPYYAPEFRVEVSGEPVPATLRASISGVSLTTGLEGSDRVEVSLVNENLRWLDHPLLALDNELRLHLGYAPDPLEQMFVGEIVGHSASFPSSGAPGLTVVAQDRLERLQRGTKERWFAIPVPGENVALPDVAVASIVSAENVLAPQIDPVGAAISILLAAGASQKAVREQLAISDFDFLSKLARENGWEMFVDHREPLGGTKLRFQSPLDHLTPDLTLEYGRSLLDFSPRISNVGQIVSVTAFVWVAPIKTRFTVTLAWDWDRMALTLDVRPELIPAGVGATDYLIEDPVTPSTAPRAILTELIPRLNKRLTGSGSIVGDTRVRAGTVLKLEGLGIQFGGLYRVTSATHSLDSGGYRTSFEARKEIWFGSIPLPEQGALPVPPPPLPNF